MRRRVDNEDQSVDDSAVRDYLVERGSQIRNSDRRHLATKTAVAAARDLNVLADLDTTLDRVFAKGYVTPKAYKGLKSKHQERYVNIVLSDLHYGSSIDPRECPNAFGPHEEARRTGRVVDQVAEYKRSYRKETSLKVHVIGDIIQNQLHDMREGTPLTEQFCAALHYLVQAVFFWASEYPHVDVYCTPGNHGRNKSRHDERAVHQKWDGIESMIYRALAKAVEASKLPNVKVHIGLRPYYVVDLFDHKAFATHGDTVFTVGYPGRVIQVDKLQKQVLKWNAARNVGGPFSLFFAGHVHIGSLIHLPQKVMVMTNGCLVPSDPFAVSIGSPDVTCGQYLFESVRGYPVGDQRFITVDDADGDKGYERLVKPYTLL